MARRILAATGGIQGLLGLGFGALANLPGVGKAKAARLIAASEMGVRTVEQLGKAGARNTGFGCSLDIYKAYRARLGVLRQEVFLVVGLNNKNESIREIIVAQGSVNECRVEPREVFRPMIAEAATKVLLLHNHPSGDSTPSPQDLSITRRLCQVGDVIGIPILDHVVIGHDSYASMLDLGLLDPSARR
jgi:DNA repair protein RadC